MHYQKKKRRDITGQKFTSSFITHTILFNQGLIEE
jgi:hypothetical protein